MGIKKSNFKIAQILSDTEVVINGGTNDGLEPNDLFQIMGKSNTEIIDPVTQKSLGKLDEEKGKIRALDVYPEMTVCVSTTLPNPEDLMEDEEIAPNESDMFKTEPKSLNVDPKEITTVKPNNSPIKVGENVRLLK